MIGYFFSFWHTNSPAFETGESRTDFFLFLIRVNVFSGMIYYKTQRLGWNAMGECQSKGVNLAAESANHPYTSSLTLEVAFTSTSIIIREDKRFVPMLVLRSPANSTLYSV